MYICSLGQGCGVYCGDRACLSTSARKGQYPVEITCLAVDGKRDFSMLGTGFESRVRRPVQHAALGQGKGFALRIGCAVMIIIANQGTIGAGSSVTDW